MKIKFNKSSKNAITLIALVISILIIIILTGIALNIALDDSGTISRTSNASRDYKYDNVYEELHTIILTAQTEDIRNEPTLKSVVSYLLNDTENEYIISSESQADNSENVGDIQTANDVAGKTEVFIIFKDFEFRLDDDLKLHKIQF